MWSSIFLGRVDAEPSQYALGIGEVADDFPDGSGMRRTKVGTARI
jgi:hypothetical protein